MKFKDFVVIGVVIAILGMVGFGLKIAFFKPHVIAKSVDMTYKITDKILDPEHAIRTYEKFKEMHHDMIAMRDNIQIEVDEYSLYTSRLPENMSEWNANQSREESSMRNSITAQKKLLNQKIAEYNAMADMEHKAIFKDDLPTNIEDAFTAGLQLTSQ